MATWVHETKAGIALMRMADGNVVATMAAVCRWLNAQDRRKHDGVEEKVCDEQRISHLRELPMHHWQQRHVQRTVRNTGVPGARASGIPRL